MLTIDSPPQMVMADLRRCCILGKLTGLTAVAERIAVSRGFFSRELAAAHVFDMGNLLGAGTDAMPLDRLNELSGESNEFMKHNPAAFLPHAITAFLLRIKANPPNTDLFLVSLVTETANLWEFTCMGFNCVGARAGSPWWLAGLAKIQRHQDVPKKTATVLGWADHLIPFNAFYTQSLASLALLSRKGDTVIIEPAEYTLANEPARPKAFETRNPSVSIVRLNTDRVLLSTPRDDESGTGETVRPHDRRAHLRRRGNRIIQVRACKIHGGAPAPTIKVAKMTQPPWK